MKLSKPTVLLSGILLFSALGAVLVGTRNAVALETARGALLLFVGVFALGAFHLYSRERKARVPAPVKIRRKEPPIILRRRNRW